MIPQPELGQKIADTRKAKGLTQEELVAQCHLNVRTLQRIEAGEVTPRSQTLKLIFEALEVPFETVAEDTVLPKETSLGKPVLILAVAAVVVFAISFLIFKLNAQQSGGGIVVSEPQFTTANAQFIHFFNAGEIDSLRTLFMENACMMPVNHTEIHGRQAILNYYQELYNFGLRFTESKSTYIIVSDSVAVDRGVWKGYSSIPLSGTHLRQWHLIDGTWYIENQMTNTDFDIVTGN